MTPPIKSRSRTKDNCTPVTSIDIAPYLSSFLTHNAQNDMVGLLAAADLAKWSTKPDHTNHLAMIC